MKIPEIEGEPHWGKLPMRLGWVFKKVYRAEGIVAISRAFWHVVIRRYVYEVCQVCGRPVSNAIHTYWIAPDELWEEINRHSGGVLCPRCFARRAEKSGIAIAWLGLRMEDVDEIHNSRKYH